VIKIETIACAAEGIPITEGPAKRVDGSDYLFCKDPDGNLIEIVKH
jgi:catechol 2,3-dioxygenase-like lactoylglutathione lyase family enzyme